MRPKINLAFQLERHLKAHMCRWPASDSTEVARDIRRRLLTGSSWLWPEPQLALDFSNVADISDLLSQK
jgi:hypothetical protein